MKQRVVKAMKWYIGGLILSSLMIFVYFFYDDTIGEREGVSISFPIADYYNRSIDIDKYKGKIVLVDFWFSGCKPCLEEMRFYPELIKRHKDLAIVSLSRDPPGRTKELLELKTSPWDFLPDSNSTWVFYNVGEEVIKASNVQEYPTYFLIDKEGNVVSSPRSGLFTVERYLGGVFSVDLSVRKYLNMLSSDESLKKNSKKLFFLYNILFAILFLISMIVWFVKDKFFKS